MEDIIKLVRTYRLTSGLAGRLRLAETIFPLIEPDLRLYVFSSISANVAEDALQETLKAIATSLKNFRGDSEKELWGWCYRIAQNKLKNQYAQSAKERTLPIQPDELLQLMDTALPPGEPAAGTRLDLEYAMKLLKAAKPDCSDLLWRHHVIGLDYEELAAEHNVQYDAMRMKLGRCLDEAISLVT